MHEVSSCLNRRYEALDNLISELTVQHMDCPDSGCTHDPEIKLLCQFWNILKEDPDCDLPQAIQHRLCMQSESGLVFGKQRFSCYMAGEQENEPASDSKEDPPKYAPVKESREDSTKIEGQMKCSTSRDAAGNADVLPLSKVICNLKEAASYDKRCHVRLNNLLASEKRLQEQIKYLEEKEKQGVEMLKQADCMWSCMEASYKQKIQESLERQKFLLKQLKDVEKSTSKWRKNKKDLESQLQSLDKCQEEIKIKINQKTNDIKIISKEIEDFKKRIESTKNESETSKKSLAGKKKISDGKLACLSGQIKELQEELKKEQMFKEDKEAEGNMYIKEARGDLQRICKLLLMKKLEHEDLKAEKQALILEINLLKDSCGQCQERCQNKQSSLDKEIYKIDKEIENFQRKCIKCHQCVDTSDVRKFCWDCPRCQAERDCIYEDDHCIHDDTTDCVCQIVKRKFLDNVFDNMYTVLERQAKTGPGKAVAEALLDCLKRSRNGKLNPETRKILQEFILSVVKKNLNLTIVGGAVKTRCEMEPQMYEKLMVCLKQVKPISVPKTDAGTDVKGEPCKRWGGPRECHCNKGPNACICTKKAPPPPKEPGPCPVNKDDEVDRCPFHKENLCGPECSSRAKGRGPCGGLPDPENIGDLAEYIPDPCQGPSCPYTKDMRAAQCVFGPEPMSSNLSFKTAMSSYDPTLLESQIICKCEGSPVKLCSCQDPKQMKANLAQNTIFKSCQNEREDVSRDGGTVQVKIKKVPSVLTEFISKSQQRFGIETDPLVENRRKKKFKGPKNREKKSCTNINFQGYITEIKNTCAGDLFIELDVDTISKIKKRANDNTNLPVSITETESRNYLIDFGITKSTSSDSEKNHLKQFPSGKMTLEVDKNIISNIYPYFRRSHSKSLVSISILRKKLPCDCKEEQLVQSKTKSMDNNNEFYNDPFKQYFDHSSNKIERRESNGKHEQKKARPVKSTRPDKTKIKNCKSIDELPTKLKLNLLPQRHQIVLKVQGKNGVFGITQAEVVKTPSRNIALSINKEDLGSIGDIPAKYKEIPVLLEILSSVYTLFLQKKTFTKARNTILRRTISGDFLVVIKEPVFSDAPPKDSHKSTVKEKIFKFKVKSTKDNIIELPAILKPTESDNYMLFLDEEFENEHKFSLGHFKNEYFEELRQTNSNVVLLNFDENKSINNKQNALLVKATSDDMKILVNGPVLDDLSLNLTNLNTDSTAHAIENKLPLTKKTCINKQKNNSEISMANVKSSSDSTLYDQLKHQTRKNDLNTVTLKRTDSGKYGILLENNDKNHFINCLKRYLSTKHQGFVPIWKGTETGEIKIDLSRRENEDDQCVSLKMSPSGNIFMIVDENVIDTVSNKMETIDVQSTKSSGQHYVMNNNLDFSPTSSLPSKYFKSDVKSRSQCALYEKAQFTLQNQKGLLDGSSATVKKTDSGQFLVILNKESKKALINDLMNSLSDRPQDRIQFWKGTDSGGITIDISSIKNNKGNFDSIKMSNSGKIYIVVNDKQLKNITKDIESNKVPSSVAEVVLKNILGSPRRTSFADSKFNYLLKTIKNKRTTTYCKGKHDNDCCQRSKCVCSGNKNVNNEYDEPETSSASSPNMPCGCETSTQKFQRNDQFCYVVDTVCSIHKDYYENLSNKILEMNGTCKKTKRNKDKGKVKKDPKTKKIIK